MIFFVNILTRRQYPGVDPALRVFDRLLLLVILLQDGQRPDPLQRMAATAVVAQLLAPVPV